MKINVTSIQTEKEEYGIFYRGFIKKESCDYYSFDGMSPSRGIGLIEKSWILKKLNPYYKKIKQEIKNGEYDGFYLKTICFPFFFKGIVRRARHIFTDHPSIKEIIVKGVELPKETCSGSCLWEKTKIIFHKHRTQKITKRENYHYYYNHIIKDLFNNENRN